MSAAPVTSVQLTKATHRRLRDFARREGYKLTALADRWIAAGLNEVERHNAASIPNEPKRSPSRVAELSSDATPPSVASPRSTPVVPPPSGTNPSNEEAGVSSLNVDSRATVRE